MTFNGWNQAKQNWSKLPHEFFDHLPEFSSKSEITVVLYVLRHTWGYGDEYKHITLDEFENGRKRKDGSRIDPGLGMSRNAIKNGINQAILHGFLYVIQDTKDKAREKRYYALTENGLEHLGGQKLTPRGSEVDPQESEVDPRTEKDTFIERNYSNSDSPESEPDTEESKENEEQPQPSSFSENGRSTNEPSPTIRKLSRNEVLKELEEHFARLLANGSEGWEAFKPQRDTQKQRKAAGALWWNDLWQQYKLTAVLNDGEPDIETTKRITTKVFNQMRNDGLTVSTPKSITQNFRDAVAKNVSGVLTTEQTEQAWTWVKQWIAGGGRGRPENPRVLRAIQTVGQQNLATMTDRSEPSIKKRFIGALQSA